MKNIIKPNLSKINQKEEKALLSFLKETRKGKYAKINESSLGCVRVKEEREDIDSSAEIYYYNIS